MLPSDPGTHTSHVGDISILRLLGIQGWFDGFYREFSAIKKKKNRGNCVFGRTLWHTTRRSGVRPGAGRKHVSGEKKAKNYDRGPGLNPGPWASRFVRATHGPPIDFLSILMLANVVARVVRLRVTTRSCGWRIRHDRAVDGNDTIVRLVYRNRTDRVNTYLAIRWNLTKRNQTFNQRKCRHRKPMNWLTARIEREREREWDFT